MLTEETSKTRDRSVKRPCTLTLEFPEDVLPAESMKNGNLHSYSPSTSAPSTPLASSPTIKNTLMTHRRRATSIHASVSLTNHTVPKQVAKRWKSESESSITLSNYFDCDDAGEDGGEVQYNSSRSNSRSYQGNHHDVIPVVLLDEYFGFSLQLDKEEEKNNFSSRCDSPRSTKRRENDESLEIDDDIWSDNDCDYVFGEDGLPRLRTTSTSSHMSKKKVSDQGDLGNGNDSFDDTHNSPLRVQPKCSLERDQSPIVASKFRDTFSLVHLYRSTSV